jgi:hypothetical protein
MDAPRVVHTVGGHSRLSLAKLVELRRRSRIDRARQLASNIDTQAQILRSTQLYNLEAARLQLQQQLGGMGANIPQAARVIHDARIAALPPEARAEARAVHDTRVARLAAMTAQVEDLHEEQREYMRNSRPVRSRVRPIPGHPTLDRYDTA